jgi:cobalamin-dependent methionine synthase I
MLKLFWKKRNWQLKESMVFFPANQVNDDDIEPETERVKCWEILTLRQQSQKQKERQISLYLIL